jgi:hypothetical protein
LNYDSRESEPLPAHLIDCHSACDKREGSTSLARDDVFSFSARAATVENCAETKLCDSADLVDQPAILTRVLPCVPPLHDRAFPRCTSTPAGTRERKELRNCWRLADID